MVGAALVDNINLLIDSLTSRVNLSRVKSSRVEPLTRVPLAYLASSNRPGHDLAESRTETRTQRQLLTSQMQFHWSTAEVRHVVLRHHPHTCLAEHDTHLVIAWDSVQSLRSDTHLESCVKDREDTCARGRRGVDHHEGRHLDRPRRRQESWQKAEPSVC
jgi:hypothetical protein